MLCSHGVRVDDSKRLCRRNRTDFGAVGDGGTALTTSEGLHSVLGVRIVGRRGDDARGA